MIYIIRHGQTELNNRKVLQGRSDYPLNDAGIAQAQEAAARLQGVPLGSPFRGLGGQWAEGETPQPETKNYTYGLMASRQMR